MSLYRKYRPQSFANLVGQDHIRTTLLNALKGNKVNHAYLFTGPRGTGKTSTARLVAKAINCENLQNGEPCEKCDICRDITDGRLIDLIEVDAASNRGIDEIRDLRDKINFAPTRAKSKVYIIDEVHMLTKEAFNALLKTLEEPPSHVYFILATTEVHKIPETILSRCQRFDFKRIEHGVLVARLAFIAGEEKIEAEAEGLDAISRVAQGGLRDAIGLLEQLTVGGKLTFDHVREVLGITGKVSLEKLYGFLEAKKVGEAIAEIGALYSEGYDLTQFTKDFLELLRQKMLASVQAGGATESSQDASARGGGAVADTRRILAWIGYFQQAYDGTRYATIPQLPLEVAIVQACIPAAGNQEGQNNGQRVATPTSIKSVSSALPTNSQASQQNNTAMSNGNTGTRGVAMPSMRPAPQTIVEDVTSSAFVDRSHQTLQKTAALSFEVLQVQWPHVVKAIKNVTAKRVLAAGKLSGFQGADVQIAFSTQFHAAKMKEFVNRLAVEEALFTVFQVQLKVVPVVDATMAPVMQAGGLDGAQSSDGSEPVDEKTSQLLAMMGGEFVE